MAILYTKRSKPSKQAAEFRKEFGIKIVFKRMLAFLVATMLICVSPTANASDTYAEIEKEMREKARATDASELLIAHLVENGYYTSYPDYFAGCYIGDDNLFHVRICSSNYSIIKELNSIFDEMVDVVKYEFVSESLNEMNEQVETLVKSLIEMGYHITTYGIDDVSGKIYVGVLRDEIAEVHELIKGWNSYSNNPNPEVMVEDGSYVKREAGIQPGNGFDNITLGAYGYYNGKKAIVTCGHGGHTEDSPFMVGTISGRFDVVQCENNEIGDYAIGLIDENATLLHAFETKLHCHIVRDAAGTSKICYADLWH